MQIDLLCPVENQGVTVKTNSKTGEPYALFKLFNLSQKVVQRVVFTVRAYDAYGNELGAIQTEFNELEGQPKSYFGGTKAVSLAAYAEAKHITAEFSEVHFIEGEPYINLGNYTDITVTEPDYDEKMRLLAAAGEDAACYAKDAGTYWLCVCGRPNMNDATNCVRCGREKAEVFSCYSSRDALTKTLADMEEKQRQEEEAQLNAAKQARAERIAKRKKIALFCAIGVVCAAILYVIAYFVYGMVMTSMGSSAAQAGDYLTAYTRYAAANKSEKVAEVSEEVRGNSNSNLMNMGMMTADEDHLYYLDPSYALYKENKQTGEKTKLSDASGAMLNVMDGWLYYLNPFTGQSLHRISTDGLVQEVVFETADSYFGNLMLVGNELYFILQEPRQDLTPEMQEQIASEQIAAYENHLYRLEIGKKKPRAVSSKDVTQLVYYKDTFYFIDQTDASVYSMDRYGNHVKKLVNGPVYGFDVYGDALYYQDATTNPETGLPTLTLVHADLDGNYIEDVLPGKMVMSFAFDGADLYYTEFSMDGVMPLYKKSGTEETIVAENCQQFNIADGYLIYISGDSQLLKMTYDKSGFEEIEMVLPSGESSAEEE